MIIFSKRGKITPNDDKTNIRLDFIVPDGAKRLVVHYSYSPKDVENEELACAQIFDSMKKYDMNIVNVSSFLPVHNFVTLSFDENGEYRGACHRQPNEQTIVIAEKNSTPGILNREIKSGAWDIVLNVHYAGCDIDYSVDVEVEI